VESTDGSGFQAGLSLKSGFFLPSPLPLSHFWERGFLKPSPSFGRGQGEGRPASQKKPGFAIIDLEARLFLQSRVSIGRTKYPCGRYVSKENITQEVTMVLYLYSINAYIPKPTPTRKNRWVSGL
jgi:hypothetical protein